MKQFIKNKVNLYLTLDILPGSSHSEILHAYNRAKSTYSGNSVASYTLVDGEQSMSIMQEIDEAYDILGNPSRRREYDLAMGYSTWSEDANESVSELRPHGPSIVTRENQVSTDLPLENETYQSLKSVPMGNISEKARPISKPTHISTPRPVAVQRPMAEVVHLTPSAGQFEPNPDFEKKIAETMEADGAFLRAVRIYRKMNPEQLAVQCKLSGHHVHSLEEEDASKLPHAVYLRGHVFMVAQVLGLPNPDQTARAYVERMKAQKKLPRIDLKS